MSNPECGGFMPDDVAPPEFTVVDRWFDGARIVTTVLVDGVFEEFVLDRQTRIEIQELTGK